MTKLPLIATIALSALTSTASAQWYQGPTGGQGGSPFDFWAESGHATDLSSVGTLSSGQIFCFFVAYRGPSGAPLPNNRNLRHGYCGNATSFHPSKRLDLAPDEYLVGVTGTYGQHINSISVYTNKGRTKSWGTRGPLQFGYSAPSGQMIVAFTGRAGQRLDALGVMYAPCPATKQCR